jgi:hypothetical protein
MMRHQLEREEESCWNTSFSFRTNKREHVYLSNKGFRDGVRRGRG